VNIFQFDECSSCKATIKACNKGGLAIARRYPKEHKNLSDPEVLRIYMAKGTVFFTQDGKIVDNHKEHVPYENPGIIMIGHSPRSPRTITASSIRVILQDFKKRFPGWDKARWRNSIVRITDHTVEVGYMSPAGRVVGFSAEFDTDGWQSQFAEQLDANAVRKWTND
jgi:hypothetical protein